MDLTTLGFTQEELQERVVARICEELLSSEDDDEYGEMFRSESKFSKAIRESIRTKINERVAQLIDETVIPRTEELISNTILQRTNQWGELKGEPITFTEYLAQRAEDYLLDDVDANGLTKQEYRSEYGRWEKKDKRITQIVDKRIGALIEESTKETVKGLQSTISIGITDAVKEQLKYFAENIKACISVPK